jgi:hypothetical protein
LQSTIARSGFRVEVNAAPVRIGMEAYLMELGRPDVPAHPLPLARAAVERRAGHLGEALHRKIDRVKRTLEPAATTAAAAAERNCSGVD